MKKKPEQMSEGNSLEVVTVALSKTHQESLEPVTNCDHLGSSFTLIEDCILTVRNQQVIVDRDLAMLYGVETKTLNQAVKRNIERFPEHFRFQLTKEEMSEVVTNCDHLAVLRFSPTQHFVFTEQGVAMLSAVLRSKTAVAVSIRIMEAFIAMRKFLASNAQLFRRIETIEYHQLEMKQHQKETDKHIIATDNKLEEILDKMNGPQHPVQGIFYNNQFFDAHTFVCDLIRSAKKRIILIDNYIDDTVLKRLDKRAAGVTATIYTDHISKTLAVDITTHNKEYTPIDIIETNKSHDRFLIIDDDLYHFGASIKDLGKKIFAFDKFIENPDSLLARL